jgi:hypothetical protein
MAPGGVPPERRNLMRIPLLAALAAAVLIVPDAASGGTLATRFPQLASEIQTRLAALQLPPLSRVEKRQKAALVKAGKPIAVDTNDLAKTLVNERLAIAALDATFKTDATIPGILDSMLSSAQFDVSERTAFLSARVDALPTSALKKKATASVTAANKQFGFSSDPKRTRVARFSALSKALAADAAGEKSARKALLTAGVVVDQIEIQAGDRYLFASTGTASNATAEFDTTIAGAFRIVGSFESQGTHVLMQMRVDSPEVGAHGVSLTTDSSYVGDSGMLSATSGTVQFTTWDPANHTAAGTFYVVFSNGTNTITVTGATFSFIDMQTP